MRQLHKISPYLYTALFLYLTALLLRYPAVSLEYAYTGLHLWLTKMVPTLLPFMILSGIMIRMNLTERFAALLHPLLHRLYGTSANGAYVMMIGFLCGFPMGARTVAELYRAGRLSADESRRLLYFCNNIGPIYFLGYVVPTLGIARPAVPFLIMYGLPLLYGLLLFRLPHPASRRLGIRNGKTPRVLPSVAEPLRQEENAPSAAFQTAALSLPAAIDASVKSGLVGIAGLGGYMIFFNLLNIAFYPFRNAPADLLRLYRCVLEITGGIDYSGQSLFYPILILLPFGGFSCIVQTYSMIADTDLPLKPYLLHKIAQSLLTALCYFLCHLLTPCG